MGALRAWDWFPLAALYFGTFQMVFGDLWDFLSLILWGCACDDSISVKIELKWHWKWVCNVSSKYSWPNPAVKCINMSGYASWSIRCELHPYPYRIYIRIAPGWVLENSCNIVNCPLLCTVPTIAYDCEGSRT
jgi:hypothetical protein